jgi:hypothetical protein
LGFGSRPALKPSTTSWISEEAAPKALPGTSCSYGAG